MASYFYFKFSSLKTNIWKEYYYIPCFLWKCRGGASIDLTGVLRRRVRIFSILIYSNIGYSMLLQVPLSSYIVNC